MIHKILYRLQTCSDSDPAQICDVIPVLRLIRLLNCPFLAIFPQSLERCPNPGWAGQETRRQYPRRLKMFLDFLDLHGGFVDEYALQFLDKVTEDIQWFEDIFMVSCKSPVCNNFLGNYSSGLHTI